jgi:hypothetical protein
MSKKIPKNTDENGRDENGRFTGGNMGKPKGATNRTTRDIREFITNFLNDKAFEIPHIWDAMDDKDKATLYLHLCRLVLPKPPEDAPTEKENFTPIQITGMEIISTPPELKGLTKEQIDKLIDKL